MLHLAAVAIAAETVVATVVAMVAVMVAAMVVATLVATLVVATTVADGLEVGCAHEFEACCLAFVAWSRCTDAVLATRAATRAVMQMLDADATKPRKLTF